MNSLTKWSILVLQRIGKALLPVTPCSTAQAAQQWRQARQVAVMACAGIGDAILTLPLIHAIRQSNPDVKILLICHTLNEPVFRGRPDVDEIICYDRHRHPLLRWLWMVRPLLRHHPQVLFAAQPSNTIFHSLLTFFTRAKLKIKVEKDYGLQRYRDFQFMYHVLLPWSRERHCAELNLDLIRYCGVAAVHDPSRALLDIDPDALARTAGLFHAEHPRDPANGLIAFHTGGKWAFKHWPIEKYARLAKHLTARGYGIVLVGGRDETGDATKIGALPDGSVINLTGRLSLMETGAALKKCQCLVCNDTGIMHLAAALGLPVVAIMGITNPAQYHPLGKRVVLIRAERATAEINVTRVLRAVESIMRQDETAQSTDHHQYSNTVPSAPFQNTV